MRLMGIDRFFLNQQIHPAPRDGVKRWKNAKAS